MIGIPTVEYLKATICMNIIKNNVVTTDDVNLGTKSYGPDVRGIKGKTTRSRPMPVVSNIAETSDELMEVQQDLTVSMGGLTVNYLKFLSNIYHELYYRSTQYFSEPVASVYEVFMDELMAVYKIGGLISPRSTATMNFAKVWIHFWLGKNCRLK